MNNTTQSSSTNIDVDRIYSQVKSGEYFRESRKSYNILYIDTLADRYLYMLFAGLNTLCFFLSVIALTMLFPLNETVPFTYYAENIDEEVPILKPLKSSAEEPTNIAIKRFMAGQYVELRETYDIDRLERLALAVQNLTSEQEFAQWEQYMDPSSAESPVARYQRLAKRAINVRGVKLLPDNKAEVLFEAQVITENEVNTTNHLAFIDFDFKDVTIDQNTGETSPLSFVVKQYRTTRF